MKRTNHCVALCAASLLLVAGPAAAGKDRDTASSATQLQNEELPEYTVVEGFFRQLSRYSDPDSPSCQNYLSGLGLEPGDPAVDEFLLAASEAGEVFAQRLVESNNTESEDLDDDSQWRDTREMGRVFGELLFSLGRIGYPVDRLEMYLETRVRSGMVMMVSGPGAVDRIREQDKIFGDEVRSVYPAWRAQ